VPADWRGRGDVDGAVNLGNPVETTVSDLARLIIDLVGSRSSLERCRRTILASVARICGCRCCQHLPS
jgi:nucleoside-diphosphate-sugar epimerase